VVPPIDVPLTGSMFLGTGVDGFIARLDGDLPG
jgi:hypothetical protein